MLVPQRITKKERRFSKTETAEVWLGSDWDHQLFVQYGTQCPLELQSRCWVLPLLVSYTCYFRTYLTIPSYNVDFPWWDYFQYEYSGWERLPICVPTQSTILFLLLRFYSSFALTRWKVWKENSSPYAAWCTAWMDCIVWLCKCEGRLTTSKSTIGFQRISSISLMSLYSFTR